MMLTDLATVLRAAGLKVVEVDGWKTRGHGGMVNVHGHTIHHNAGGRTHNPKAGLKTIVEGRSDLPGPLAQTYVDVEGTWYVVAAGLAYHAGVSLENDYTNPHRIGTEAQAAGDGWSEDWPEVQMVSLAVGAKALAKHYGYPISEILGHKETCSPVGRKVDPSFSMTKFRDRVKAAPTNLEDDVTEKELKDAIREVLQEKLVPNVDANGVETGKMSLVRADDLGDQKLDFIKATVKRLEAAVTAQGAVLQAIAANSPDAIRAATDEFVAKVKAELAEVDVHVTLGDEG
jgi:hypothetical protein